jgi:hypothetical protein
VALARQDIDMSETVIGIVEPLLLPPTGSESDDPDAMDTTENNSQKTQTAGYK